MKVIALQSGSTGNCIYVEAADARLLFDAGISGRQAQLRLADYGRDIREVDALVISHDHRDHVCGMRVFQNKFGMPVHVTEKTLAACGGPPLKDVRHYEAGGRLRFGSVTVETIPTPHDCADGVAFVVDDGRCRLGILTDLGHPFDGLDDVLRSLDAVLLESNYDPLLLARGAYPPMLQQRIRGPRGHLSNHEAAELLGRAAGPRLQWACLAHLSERNNAPALAVETHQAILGERLPLHVASGRRASQVFEV
jgi:phosphoribosyl 1,2-cyclic phosphodiesterase